MSDDDFSSKPLEEIPGSSDRQKEHRKNPPKAFCENAISRGAGKSAMVKAGWGTRRENKVADETFNRIFRAFLNRKLDGVSITSARKWLPEDIDPAELDHKSLIALKAVRIAEGEDCTSEVALKAMGFIRDTIGEEPIKRTSDESQRPPSIVINAVSSLRPPEVVKTIETSEGSDE